MGAYRKIKVPPKLPSEGAVDLEFIRECFTKCPQADGSLSTDHYLCAAHELLK